MRLCSYCIAIAQCSYYVIFNSSKSFSSKQTNNSLNEITESICNSTSKYVIKKSYFNDLIDDVSPRSSNSPQLIPSTIELLVYAYANVDQDIRLCASENLRKLVKVCDNCVIE